jgi:hypothetical protein
MPLAELEDPELIFVAIFILLRPENPPVFSGWDEWTPDQKIFPDFLYNAIEGKNQAFKLFLNRICGSRRKTVKPSMLSG